MTPFHFQRCRLRRAAVFLFFLSLAVPSFPFETPAPGSAYLYPSPAKGDSAWVVFNMPQSGSAEARVYNEAGDLILDVANQEPEGVQQMSLDLTYVRRGVYLCQVRLTPAGDPTQILRVFEFSVVR